MAATWLSGGYAKRLSFTVQARSGSIVSPVGCIILGNNVGLNGFDARDVLNTLGVFSKKIAVTRSDGTSECWVEVAYWNTSDKKATIFFNTGETIPAAETRTYFLYYGLDAEDNTAKVGLTGEAIARNVWKYDGNAAASATPYLGVWHCQQSPVLASPSVLDSNGTNTLVGGDGDASPSSLPVSVNSPLGKAIEFDGVDDCLYSPTFARNQFVVMVEAYFSLKSAPNTAYWNSILYHNTSATTTSRFMYGFAKNSSQLYKGRDEGNQGDAGAATAYTCLTTTDCFTYFGSHSKTTSTFGEWVIYDTVKKALGSSFTTITSNPDTLVISQTPQTGILWVGGFKNPSATQGSGFVNIILQELRYSTLGKDVYSQQWTSQSLMDGLNTFIGIEVQGINSGNMTVEFTGRAEGGAVGNPSIFLTGHGECGASGEAIVPFVSSGSYAGWRGNLNALIEFTSNSISYNYAIGTINIPAIAVEADGYQWNYGQASCLFNPVQVYGEGSAQTKDGGVLIPRLTLEAVGAVGQLGTAAAQVGKFTAYGVGSGQGSMQIGKPTLYGVGVHGAYGIASIALGIDVTASGVNGIIGSADLTMKKISLYAMATQTVVAAGSFGIKIKVRAEGINGLTGIARMTVHDLIVRGSGQQTVLAAGAFSLPITMKGIGYLQRTLPETTILRHAR